MSTIESSVTRLLVSTKHLLESLTQWARQDADDKFVSDAYVKLGNDFRAATRAFSAAGVDISDLGDVPRALRIVLESALSEAPTQENLDRFLPKIRNIIVSLLLSLKQKQSKAVTLAEERLERHSNGYTSCFKNEATLSRDLLTQPSSRADVLAATEYSKVQIRSEEVGGNIPRHNGHIRSSSVITKGEDLVPSSSDPKLESGSDIIAQKDTSEPSADRALAELQRSNVILRRASKRFSAYQFAKLANFSGNLLPKISTDSNLARDDASQEPNSKAEVDSEKATEESNSETGKYVFLRIKDSTKKCPVHLPITMTSLRLLFIEKFAYSPGISSFPDIYIVDPKTNVAYELEDSMLQAEIRGGSLLELKEQNSVVATYEMLQDKLLSLESQFLTFSTKIIAEIGTQISQIDIKAHCPSPTVSQDSSARPLDTDNLRVVTELQQELKALKQMHRTKNEMIREILTDLAEQISALKLACLESGTDESHRSFMQHSYSKLSEESDSLLTKVDDLQDMMEAIRKDVAQRGVRLGPKQLKATAKEILDAELSLKTLVDYIREGKPSWKKIWESELDKVCEEQQFFNLQDDLTRDLDEDINKIKETFGLIEKCCSEQSKQPLKRNVFAANVLMLEPGDSIHGVKDAVLVEVSHLVPDHASRLDAIERAERLRKKEREIESLNQFQEELGDFVADQRLKKSGGIEGIERMRQEKDIENFKSTFGIV